MFKNKPTHSSEDIDLVARRGPRGALTLCTIAAFVVVVIWFAFYFLAFLPRGQLR